MEIISSNKNPFVLKILKIKNECDGLQLFLDNPKTIEEAFYQGLKINYILIDKKLEKYFLENYKFLSNQKIIIVESSVIKFLSDTTTPQGIVAVVELKQNILTKISNNFLVLENLQDPGNLGTIIRSAKGTNFKDIVLINCVSPYNQKVVRSTMGSLFFENLYIFKSTQSFIDYAKLNDLKLIVADMGGKNIFKINKPDYNFGLVIGNEGNGVSNIMKNSAKQIVSIPMKNDLESLNAGVACAMMMFYFDNL